MISNNRTIGQAVINVYNIQGKIVLAQDSGWIHEPLMNVLIYRRRDKETYAPLVLL